MLFCRHVGFAVSNKNGSYNATIATHSVILVLVVYHLDQNH